jgi:hypothetical protein
MDKDTNNLALLHTRSTAAVIRDGYKLYIANFRNIFKSSWTAAAFYALVIGALQTLADHLTAAIAVAVILIALIPLYASGATTLSRHQQTGVVSGPKHWWGSLSNVMLRRSCITAVIIVAAFTLFACGYYCVGYIGTKYLSHIAFLALVYTITLGFSILLAPIVVGTTKYTMHLYTGKKTNFFLPFRYWGSAIIILFVVCIITMVLIAITELPAVILLLANLKSQAGALQGDPTGMPEHMLWLNLIVFSLAAFVQAFVLLTAIFPFYYLNGSLAMQEQERKNINQQ